MSWEILALLFLAGLTAGFIDAIAGGGGLITVPALLWAGLDPQTALGTNKMQSVFGTAMAVRRYATAGLIDRHEVRLTVLVTFLAAATGAWVVTLVSNDLLDRIVPWLLLGLAVYLLASPRLGKEATRSIAYTKVANLTSNAASLLVFLSAGLVRFDVAAVMIAGQLLGGRLGAGMAIRHGAPFIRVIFIGVVLAMTGKLLWEQFSG